MHYYTFNIGDYRRDTGHLTPLEHGIYRALLDTYYLQEGPLVADDDRLMRLHCIRTEAEQIAYRQVIQEFFTLATSPDGEVYTHKRCDAQLGKMRDRSEQARKSVQQRWAQGRSRKKKVASSKDNTNAIRTYNDRNTDVARSYGNSSANGMLPNTHNPIPITHNPIYIIYNHWLETMHKPPASTKLTPKRKKAVTARLKDGYTVDQIKQAIDGCARDPFHMGDNTSSKRYNDLELICRSGEKLESFLEGPVQQVASGKTKNNIRNTEGAW